MPSYRGQIPRTNRIDDDGTRTRGTPINNAELQAQYDAIEAITFSGNHPHVAVNSLIDSVMAGIPFAFGGNPDVAESAIAYPVGAAINVLAPGTRPWVVDAALLQYGTYRLEAVLSTSNVAYRTWLGLFNLTDAPDVPIVEISSIVVNGELVVSDPIAFPAAGLPKTYGVKLRTDNAAGFAKAWGIRLVRSE